MPKAFKKTALKILAFLGFILLIFITSFQYSRSWQNGLILKPVYQLETNEKLVALTFDDDPSPSRTPALLDLLDQHEVKATFFMLGQNIEKYPDIAQNVFDRGHLIGNHGYDHTRLIFKSPAFIKNQINQTDALIKEIGQKEIKNFRPPFSSKYLALPWILKSMNKNLVTGTYDPLSEYLTPFPAEAVANEVINNVKPGSIIFLHDGKNTDADAFIQSMEMIITDLKQKGYQFTTL